MKKTLKRLWEMTRLQKRALAALIIFALAANALVLAAPYISGRAIDDIRGEGDVGFSIVLIYISFLAGIYVLNAFCSWGMTAFTGIVANRVIRDMRKAAFDRISRLPLKFFDSRPRGDIISRMTNDIDAVSEGLLQGITQLFSGLVTVIGSLAIMFWLNHIITLAVLAITVICILVSRFIASRSTEMFRRQSKTIGELNGYIEEMVGSRKVVSAFGYENRAQKSFEEINSRLYDCGQKAQFYSSLVNPTTRYINNIAYISVGLLGGVLALSGSISVGIISSFLIYATQFARPINDMTSILTQLQSAGASAERVFALIDEECEADDSALPALDAADGKVEFKDVAFSYSKDKPLIEDMSISVKAGDTVAIVGPTGAGKTTIVNLLMRFYDVDNGKILINGTDIQKVSRSGLRQNFAMVLQDTWLFKGTVRENIAYGREDASDAQIIDAAKQAHAHSFIKRLPDGYNTVIAEDGGNLSEGQKQLLTIARAMLAEPKILILDEATSNVDTMTEQRIQKAFLKMMSGRTSFVIAHRLSTIRGADLILVMKDGHIIEQGNHENLMKSDTFYRNLYRS